jgi:hypothetical protein
MKIFVTREGFIYDIIVSSIIFNEEKRFGSKIEILKTKKKIICSFSFLYFFIKNFFLLNFFLKKKILYLNYKNCNIGMHVLANVYRNIKSYKSIFYYYYNFFKDIYLAGAIVDHAYKISNNIKIAYIDHAGYLNGLYFRVFALKKKIVYTNNYPRGIFFIDFRKKENFYLNSNDKALKLFIGKKVKKISYNKNKLFVDKIINNPHTVPWMATTKFINKINTNFKLLTHVIYCHSFVDGQLWFGNDGFVNLKEWLIFTIEKLSHSQNRVLIKAHPNFYNSAIDNISKWDREIFNKIKKKYESQNIIFLNEPTKNGDLLKNLSKKTVLISHHGTALLEGLFSGFKCISSTSTFWDANLKLTNSWRSQDEYKRLLDKDFYSLNFPRKFDLSFVSEELFLNPVSEYGKKYWYKILLKELKKFVKFKKNDDLINLDVKINKYIQSKIAKKLSFDIKEIKY